MTTQMRHPDQAARDKEGKRTRLTLDIDPELHMRIKMAAVRRHLSMRELIERLLLEALPAEESGSERQPMSPDVVSQLRKTRKTVTGGRVASDSTEIVRRMREERSEHLSEL